MTINVIKLRGRKDASLFCSIHIWFSYTYMRERVSKSLFISIVNSFCLFAIFWPTTMSREVAAVDCFTGLSSCCFVFSCFSWFLIRHQWWVSEIQRRWGRRTGRRMKSCRRKRTRRGPLPAEQVAAAQSHKIDLAGASRPNGSEEHLRRRCRQNNHKQ